MRCARTYRWVRMHRHHAVFTEPGIFFAVRSWADCITNMFGFDLRQAHGLRIVLFEDCSAFTRVAACTLALSPIRDTLIEGFSHFVTSVTAPIAIPLIVTCIKERHWPFDQLHDCDIAGRTDLQRADFWRAIDNPGGIYGSHGDHLLQRVAEREKLAHYPWQVGHARRVTREHVAVGRNRT